MSNTKFIHNSRALELLTPGQLGAIQEFLTLPEYATIWVVDNFTVWQGFKIRALFKGTDEEVHVAPSPDSSPVGIFVVGEDAFYTELEAIQSARLKLMHYLNVLISQGEYLADRERQLTKGENE
jgi:hypothetical protein